MGEILDMIPSAEEFLFVGAPVKLENKSSASRIQWWEQVWDRCSQSQREALEKIKGSLVLSKFETQKGKVHQVSGPKNNPL